jgi:hypothetical protein
MEKRMRNCIAHRSAVSAAAAAAPPPLPRNCTEQELVLGICRR